MPSSVCSSTVVTAPARSAALERVRAAPLRRAHSGSVRRRDRPRSVRDRQPLATTSVRTPWTESGWTNTTSSPKRPVPRHAVDQLRAGRLELVERCAEVVRLERDVVHPRAAAREEAADRRVVARRRDELEATLADEHRRRLDALLVERLADARVVRRRGARTSRSPRRDRSPRRRDDGSPAPARCYPRPSVAQPGARAPCRPSRTSCDSGTTSARSASSSERSSVSFSRSAGATRSSAARCL